MIEPSAVVADDLWAADEAEWDRQLVTAETGTGGPLDDEPEVLGDFWTRRRVLSHIRDFARARRVAPWAVLGGVLCRVICCCDPNVQLPPTIGSHASINLFAALVGPSGAGKDAAAKVARDCLDLGECGQFPVVPLGSGEGLSHIFMRLKDGEIEQYNVTALVTVGEIDTLTALVKRQSSTVASQLRQAAMGEQLGFFYVDTAKRMLVPEHRYRLCLAVGVQPKRAGALLAEADGGTPQRFIWMPATDPDAPDVAPTCPPPMRWVPPHWEDCPTEVSGGMARNVVGICEAAESTVVQAHLDRTRGKGDALDGHALLTRLKVAAALAILEGRFAVNDEDWALASEVMAVSDFTREQVLKVLQVESRRENRMQAEAEAARSILVDDRKREAATKRVSASLVRYLGEARGWVAHSDLRGKLPSRDRKEHFDAAISALILGNRVDRQPLEHRGNDGWQYQLMERAA